MKHVHPSSLLFIRCAIPYKLLKQRLARSGYLTYVHAYVCVQVIEALLGRVQFIFIENICNDPEILRQNYFNKMLYSPDYKGVPTEQVGAMQVPGTKLKHCVWHPLCRAMSKDSTHPTCGKAASQCKVKW